MPVTLVTAFVPLDCADDWDALDPVECAVDAHAFSDPDLPALFAFGVRDFDETRGLLLVGNAFGELALHDFSGSDVVDLSRCFVQIEFPSLDSDNCELAPTVSILGFNTLRSNADEANRMPFQ